MPWLQLQSALGLTVLVLIGMGAVGESARGFLLAACRHGAGASDRAGGSAAGNPAARNALYGLNRVVDALSSATQAGSSFVFGYVGGGAPPFDVTKAQNMGSLAFQACRWCS
jgi:CNT family concentrative nucleoside transporter